MDCVKEAKIRLQENLYDAVVLDIIMSDQSGIDLLRSQKELAKVVPFVLISGHPNMGNAREAIQIGAAVDYLVKPVSPSKLRETIMRAIKIKEVRDENRRLAADNLRYKNHLEELVQEKSAALLKAYEEVSRSYDFTLEALVAMLDAREKSTGKHSMRVREFSMILAREMNVPKDQLDDIARGTLLHDIGKIAIPDSILLKPGKLTGEEWDIMRTHAKVGYEIIQSSKQLSGAAEIILSHHEKYDGSGYPRGLKGDAICLGARIFSVVDAYDAMRSVRIYQGALPEKEAVEEIKRCAGHHFDPKVVEAFMTCQPRFEKIAQWNSVKPSHP